MVKAAAFSLFFVKSREKETTIFEMLMPEQTFSSTDE